MEITLSDFMSANGYTHILEAKKHLLFLLRKGYLFAREDVASMRTEEPFQLYYYMTSNSTSARDAFPIPTERFYRKEAERDIIKEHFEAYYIHGELHPDEWMSFDFQHAFIGEEYVWLYKASV